jgi:6-phosphogluconolactonase
VNQSLTRCSLSLLICLLAVGASAQTARYAYSIEANSNHEAPALVGYSVDPTTGYLRPLESFVISSDNYDIVVDPSNKFLYIPSGGQILGYELNVHGGLQAISGSPFSLDGGSALIFSPNGKFAYSNRGAEFSLNGATGKLTQIGTASTGAIPYFVAVNPAGTFVYIPNFGDGTISGFSINQATGVLTEVPGSPFAAGEDNPDSDVVTPDGKFLIVPANDDYVAVFRINPSTGALAPVAGSPFPSSSYGNAVAVNPTSQFVYIAGESLGAYSINSSTGALIAIPGSPYRFPNVVNSVTLDPTGKFLYASLSNDGFEFTPGIVAYSISSSTGALTRVENYGGNNLQVEALAFSTGAKAVTYTPKFAYATNSGSNSISEWTIKDSTGALTAVAGSPITDTNGPQVVATTPSGAFVYTGNSNNSVSEYSVNATSGALTKVSGSPLTGFGSVNGLAVDSTSTYLYILDSAKEVVDSYSINAKTGALTPFSSTSSSAQTKALALDPTGAIAVVSGTSIADVWGIGAGLFICCDGVWQLSTTVPFGNVTFDQSSRYIFAAEPGTNALATINAYGYPLAQLYSTATGNHPGAILAEPSGKYVYVANTTDGTISAYVLSNSKGTLAKLGSPVTAAAGANSLAVSNDGKFLYATDGAAGLVSIFKISADGTLTAVGSATAGTSPTSIATTGTNQ